eukprot:m.345625 g.345625  ORF g.345625 m.345625 type:complete len:124 (+) comp26920_c0_seq1:161-532(+)
MPATQYLYLYATLKLLPQNSTAFVETYPGFEVSQIQKRKPGRVDAFLVHVTATTTFQDVCIMTQNHSNVEKWLNVPGFEIYTDNCMDDNQNKYAKGHRVVDYIPDGGKFVVEQHAINNCCTIL